MLGKIPFEDDRVVFQRWGELKPKTPFGQLPVMEVDGETYAQSGAMLQYAGKLAGLVPKDPKACLRVDEAIGLDEDLRGKIRPSVALSMDASVSPRAKKAKIAEMRKKLAEKDIPYYMSHFDKMLENKEYLTGSKPTVADAQFVVTTRYLSGGILDGGVPAARASTRSRTCSRSRRGWRATPTSRRTSSARPRRSERRSWYRQGTDIACV